VKRRRSTGTSSCSALKKALTGFSRLSKKHGSFIGTLDPDEFVGCLQDAAALSGFLIEAGVDLTQEYRTRSLRHLAQSVPLTLSPTRA
jgi:hypothetical protein